LGLDNTNHFLQGANKAVAKLTSVRTHQKGGGALHRTRGLYVRTHQFDSTTRALRGVVRGVASCVCCPVSEVGVWEHPNGR
jgi:hypothetical protein